MGQPTLLSGSYRPRRPFIDELFEADGSPRPAAGALIEELRRLGPEGLIEAGRRRDAVFMQQGITFETSGENGASNERPFPLDLVPRVLTRRGMARHQARPRAADPCAEPLRRRRLPRAGDRARGHRAVAAGGGVLALRASGARHPPAGGRVHARRRLRSRAPLDGSWKVIEDNVRIPSGISYMLENRAAMARLVPELFASYRVRRVDHYPQLLLHALRSAAPSAESEATVVVWTPGPANPAYFEHAFLARQMGVELVEASDLVVRDDVLYMRTTRGLERVHAVYRRIDDDFVDPLEFRPTRCWACRVSCAPTARQRRDRERLRHGRGGRQGDLLLRAGDDPLLPRRGADPRERQRPTCCPIRSARVRARAPG